MKKALSVLLLLMQCGWLGAQNAARQITYQLLVLDQATGHVRANADVAIRVEVREGSPEGALAFGQDFNCTTDKAGTCTILLDIPERFDWSAGDHYFSTLIDGQPAGSSKITSVPYALYAQKAGQLTGTISREELVGTWEAVVQADGDDIATAVFNADGTGSWVMSYYAEDPYSTSSTEATFNWTLSNAGVLLLTQRKSREIPKEPEWDSSRSCLHILQRLPDGRLFIPRLAYDENDGSLYTKK